MSPPSKPIDAGEAATASALHQVVVDARGHRCPTPTLRLRRALDAAPEGASVILLADDPLARIDVPHFLAVQGYEPALIAEADGLLRISVRKRRVEGSFGKDCAGIL